MIIIFDKINNQYFINNDVNEFDAGYSIEDTNINVTVPTEIQGEASLTGNIHITTAFKA